MSAGSRAARTYTAEEALARLVGLTPFERQLLLLTAAVIGVWLLSHIALTFDAAPDLTGIKPMRTASRYFCTWSILVAKKLGL
jgi:hypothetical protein